MSRTSIAAYTAALILALASGAALDGAGPTGTALALALATLAAAAIGRAAER